MAVVLTVGALAFPAMAVRNYIELYGDPVPASAAGRTITINPETRYVNVEGGSAVTFVAGDKSFTWLFNGAGNVGAFDLNLVAPPGMLDHKVRAYVSPDMRRLGA
jgi:hypothetical protein